MAEFTAQFTAHERLARARLPRGPGARRLAVLLAGVSGCLFLIVATSRPLDVNGTLFTDPPLPGWEYGGLSWGLLEFLAGPIVGTAVGLAAVRWWPYLLLAAGLLAVPQTMTDLTNVTYPFSVTAVCAAGYPLAVIGVLACAQSLFSGATGWSAAVAGLTMGVRLGGINMISWSHEAPLWRAALIAVGLVGLAPAVWCSRRGDPGAAGPGDAAGRSRPPVRLIVTGTLAASVVIPLSLLTTQRLADILGVTWWALYRHGSAELAIVGAITLVTVTVLATVAGPWSLGGALTAAAVQVAVVAPVMLAEAALIGGTVRVLGTLAGVVLGAVAASNRYRVALAGTLAVVSATALFIAYVATTGQPEKLEEQHSTIPALLILLTVIATATAVVGATAPVLAPRGALPAVLGPLAAMLAGGGLQTVEGTYRQQNLRESTYRNPMNHVTTAAVMLLVVGAAIAGLGFARQLAARRAERQHTEQIRREAAAAERDRLARPIHDGVLQVLALVQRHGSNLGGEGGRLAALAGEQEVALRNLLTSGAAAGIGGADRLGRRATRGDDEDLCGSLRTLASPAIEVAAPAEPVVLPALAVAELTAAVRAALDNVRRHAGAGARAWVLIEDEPDGVRVTVRDDGVGFGPHRLAEAAEAGRLGVAQSMRGRIADAGGTTAIHSTPGEGTEVEFWVPRRALRR